MALNEFRCRTNRATNSTLCRKAAFTLAETLIVLVILGIIASITIPAVVRNQMEAQNRTRIRKSMTVYDMSLSKMVVENNLKSNEALTQWGNGNNCVNTRAYFKSAEDGNNNCIFKSSDNVWWDITDITRPIIGLDRNMNNHFQMFGHFDNNGSLRVDDIQYDMANLNNENYIQQSDIDNMTALWDFANNVKTKTGGDDKPKSFLDDCDKVDDTHYSCGGTIFVPKTGNGACVDFPSWADDAHKEKQSCGTDKTVWVTENVIVSYEYGKDATDCTKYNTEACNKWGADYHAAAKDYCESKGTHLATLGELKSLGYTNYYIWVSEENGTDYAYNLRSGIDFDFSYDYKAETNGVVCVGN